MRAMILAAGLGTRLRPLTELLPKPMLPIANRPVLEHLLRLLRRHGVTQVVINLHWLADAVRGYFGDGRWLGMELTWSFEPTLLGTAGGIKQAEAFLQEGTFLVLLGDVLTDIDLTAMVADHHRTGALATLAAREVDEPASSAVWSWRIGAGRAAFGRTPPGLPARRCRTAGSTCSNRRCSTGCPRDATTWAISCSLISSPARRRFSRTAPRRSGATWGAWRTIAEAISRR